MQSKPQAAHNDGLMLTELWRPRIYTEALAFTAQHCDLGDEAKSMKALSNHFGPMHAREMLHLDSCMKTCFSLKETARVCSYV